LLLGQKVAWCYQVKYLIFEGLAQMKMPY
jgi:hypothetical protein